jgi:hypothetical protein
VWIVRTDVSEERSSSIIRVTRIGELGTKLAVTSNRSMLRSTSVLTRATRHHVPGDGILHSHRSENHKSYTDVSLVRNSFSVSTRPNEHAVRTIFR